MSTTISGTSLNVHGNITTTNNGNISATGDVEGSSFNGGQLGGRRNLIINGAMEVWQRGTSFSGSFLYSADRWQVDNTPDGTADQSTDSPDDFEYSLKVDPTSGNAVIRQAIELPSAGKGGRFRSGQTFTLSFWIKSDNAGEAINIFIASATGVLGTTTTHVNDTSTGLTTNTTWTKYTYTYTQASNVGGSDTCYNIVPYVATPSGAVYFTGIQLELGDTATPFEHRFYAEELALCQRYYNTDFAIQYDTIGSPYNDLSTIQYAYYMRENYPVTMRTNPTLTYIVAKSYAQSETLTSSFVNFGNTNKKFSIRNGATGQGAISYAGDISLDYTADAEF